MEPLLRVEDRFLVAGRVLVTPHLPLSPDAAFLPFTDTVEVRRPDGTTRSLTAQFTVQSLPVTDDEQRLGVTVLFSDVTKEDIPVGSVVFVSLPALEAIGRRRAPKT